MKKYIFPLILLSALTVTQLLSQAPLLQWQNTIGGTNGETLSEVFETSDGGYLVGGYTYSGISGDKTENVFGAYEDFWIIKLNSEGTIVWQNDIGGTATDRLTSMSETSDGGFILGGYSSSIISGDKSEDSHLSMDYWFLKVDAMGNIIWQNTIGGTGDDLLQSIEETPDGGYIIGGTSNSNKFPDNKKEDAITNEFGSATFDYWIIKVDNIGNIVWQNTIGGNDEDFLAAIHPLPDGGYIVGGYSASDISGDKTLEVNGGLFNDFWILKLNALGKIVWQTTVGGNYTDYLEDIILTSDGNYLVGGTSSGNYHLAKLNGTGEIIWEKFLGGSDGEELRSITETTTGDFIIGGNSSSGISGDKTDVNRGFYDYWILMVDDMGNILWDKTIGGNNEDLLNSVEVTSDGGIVLGGSSFSDISGEKTEACILGYDYWVIKLYPDCIISPELCNAMDDDCNGLIDDDITETINISADGATTFCQGGSVLLSATYSGTTVQWKKNGVNIPGATSATYNANIKGTYTCETTSPCDVTLSSPIIINVLKNPTATISAGGATTFCTGGSVTLTEAAVAGSNYQWYKGATAIVGATSVNYIATTAGNYKCRVTKTASGCFKNSNTINVTVPCKEGEINAENEFTIYPNPNNGTFTLSASSASLLSLRETNNLTIQIFNTLGEIVFAKNLNLTDANWNETISLDNLYRGIYYVNVNDKQQILIIQ